MMDIDNGEKCEERDFYFMGDEGGRDFIDDDGDDFIADVDTYDWDH